MSEKDSEIVQGEDEGESLEKLQKKNERLQSILIKAKGTITQYKSKIDELEKELYQTLLKANELQALNSKLLKYEPPRADSIIDTLCRVKFLDEVHCYVKTQKANYWVSENYYKSKGVLPDLLDNTCTKKNFSEQFSIISKDWQEKVQKLTEKISDLDSKNLKLNETIKEQQIRLESFEKEAKKLKDSGICNLVTASSEIYDLILNLILDDHLDSVKISAIQKVLNGFIGEYFESEVGKVKDHCTMLLKSLLDVSKRLLHARNELKTQDQAWRTTCDVLLHEKEELKHQVAKLKIEISGK